MWFVYVAVGLVLLTAGGLYTRRRIAAALTELGLSDRAVRVVRWAIGWLLFGFPLLAIVTIAVSLSLGWATMPRFDGALAGWLLGVPFLWAVLIVFQSLGWLLALEVVHVIARRRIGAARAARLRGLGVLAVVAVFAVYTPARFLAERGDLRVRRHQVGVAAPTTPVPFRIAFVADVQQDAHLDAAQARAVYATINASQPDLILSGGDWINSGPDHIASAAATAGMLTSRLGTFSVRGDHEHFAYFDRHRSVAEVEQALGRHGVALLDNEVRWFEHQRKRIAIVFLNYNYIQRADQATVARLLAGVAGADYTIAVTHQLDRALAAQLVDQVDLILAAHTHGGQINPVIGLWHVNLAGLETEFVDGRYQRGRSTIIVTAGIGYSIIPIRYASPGSVELIELRL